MTGLTRSTADLDPRRKRLLFRAWHRGTREMDLLFGRFVEARIETFDEATLRAVEALLDVPDPDLFAWLSGVAPVPDNHDTAGFRAFRAFHGTADLDRLP